MAESIDEITVNWSEGDELVVEELDKKVLSRGAWSTIVFKYREKDRRKDEWGKVKFTIRRYQKRSGVFRQQSKFNISSVEQAQGLIEALTAWTTETED